MLIPPLALYSRRQDCSIGGLENFERTLLSNSRRNVYSGPWLKMLGVVRADTIVN
jgi:hypothetical protein